MTPLLRQPAQFLDFFKKLFGNIGAIPLAVMLIVGATLGWIAFQEYRQAQESEYRLLEAHARNAEVQVAGALDKINRLLEAIAEERLQNGRLQDNAFAAELNRYRQDIPELGTLLVTDASGRIRTATDAAIVGRDVSQETYFVAHLDQGQTPKMFISRPDKRLLGVTAATFTLPIVSADRQFLGIVGVTIGFRFFPRVVQAINSDDSASMSVIFNRDGDLLLRLSEPEKFFGFNITKVSTVFNEHSSAGRQVTRHIGPSAQNGKTRLFLIREVGDTGLGLILSRQFDEVLAIWRRNVVVYVLIFVFTSAVVKYLTIVAARRKRQVLAGKAFSDQLIATANVMVVGLDAIGRITIFNEAAERISGYQCDEVLGHSWFELAVPSKAFPGMMEMFGIFRDGGDLPHTVEYPILTKAGQEHIISWQNSVIEEPRAAIFFGIDVTERKQMEVDLVAAKQLAENSNTAKSKFLAAASHDLRQPIHAQGLFLGVLARSELSAGQREVLDSARAASEASVEMLNTLLDFSRIEGGVVKPQMRPFHLQHLLNKIERELAPQADAKGLVYRSRETHAAVQSDPALVDLILRNLVSNAIRYTERGGVLVACRTRADAIVLEVWDTGIGIEPSQQQEIFREFHQLGNAERDRRKGLGLGLAIVDGLARALGHDLSLASTPQRGSVFRLVLPMTRVAVIRDEFEATQNMTQELNVRVLVIDDDEAVRAGMLQLLRDWGCACEAAESIEEALALARVHPPGLVISDYRLREERTGVHAIAALRAEFGPQLPALLITGDTAPERQREVLTSGVPMLHKPVAPDQLYRALTGLLSECNADRSALPELAGRQGQRGRSRARLGTGVSGQADR